MKSISKKTGKIFTGKLAALMVRIGAAISLEDQELVNEVENLEDEPVQEQPETAGEDVTDGVAESVEELLPNLEEETEKEKTTDQETEKVKLIKSSQPAKKPAAKRKPAARKANVKRVKK